MDRFITLTALTDPTSIYFWPYIVVSFLMTVVSLVFFKKLDIISALKTLFSPEIWISKSTFTDFVVAVVYVIFFSAPTAALQLYIGSKLYNLVLGQRHVLGNLVTTWSLPVGLEAILVAITMILSFDLATYVGHRLMHSIPALWDIHLVHHTPKTLNMFSAYRQNPLDRLIRNSLGGAFSGIGVGMVHIVLPQQTPSATILGAGAGFFLFMLTVHLQHSHIPIHYPRWMRLVLLSPHLHQIHHSADQKHFDKNFGGIFSIWDRFFGTLHDEELSIGDLEAGLAPSHDPIKDSIWRCYLHPLLSWADRLATRFAILTSTFR